MDKKKRNGDLYTFLYAAIMVTITAALLAFVSQILKPRQEANKQVEMQQSILRAVHLADRSYEQYIKDTVVGVQRLPLYICTLDDGSRKFIIPLSGKGLWGPLWGYLALDDNGQTIYGVDFDHEAETPGLGAEVSRAEFSAPFRGKSLYRDSTFVSISVLQPGKGGARTINQVDGISGGTITSRGIENMIGETIELYIKEAYEQTHLP